MIFFSDSFFIPQLVHQATIKFPSAYLNMCELITHIKARYIKTKRERERV